MKNTSLISSLVVAASLCASVATAEVVPLSPAFNDGPWIEMDDSSAVNVVLNPTFDDIVKMADLDGEPAIVTPEEAEMIALLSQVLGSRPITN